MRRSRIRCHFGRIAKCALTRSAQMYLRCCFFQEKVRESGYVFSDKSNPYDNIVSNLSFRAKVHTWENGSIPLFCNDGFKYPVNLHLKSLLLIARMEKYFFCGIVAIG